MSQRKRFGVVLLLVAGLVALLSRPVPAQNAPPDWGAPGAQPVVSSGQPQVIATTRTTPLPVISGESKLPPPDDGLPSPKLNKAAGETQRIDAVLAALMGISRYIVRETVSVYETQGM